MFFVLKFSILLVFLKYSISWPRAWMKQEGMTLLELNQATGSMIVNTLSDNCHLKLLYTQKFAFTFVPILST